MTSCEVTVSLHIKLLQPAHVPKYFRTGTGHILEDNRRVSEVPLFFFSLSGGSVKINST
jgi:hypothetical protein